MVLLIIWNLNYYIVGKKIIYLINGVVLVGDNVEFFEKWNDVIVLWVIWFYFKVILIIMVFIFYSSFNKIL